MVPPPRSKSDNIEAHNNIGRKPVPQQVHADTPGSRVVSPHVQNLSAANRTFASEPTNSEARKFQEIRQSPEVESLKFQNEQLALEVKKWQRKAIGSKAPIATEIPDDHIVEQCQLLYARIRNWAGKFAVEQAIDQGSSSIDNKYLGEFRTIAPHTEMHQLAGF